jgi:hypothetical protein
MPLGMLLVLDDDVIEAVSAERANRRMALTVVNRPSR